jgi:hypothetical protein
LQAALALGFETTRAPVLVAAVQQCDGMVVETARGFIVPDDWRARAAQHQAGKVPTQEE